MNQKFGPLVLFVIILLSGCLNGSDADDAVSQELGVEADEFKFIVSTDTVKAGALDITIKNKGSVSHEFVLLKEKDVPNLSPTIVRIDRSELEPGTEKTIRVNLEAGVYEIGCHIPKHYKKGMKTTLNVVN